MTFDSPPPVDVPSHPVDVPRQLLSAEAAWRPIGRAVRWATFDAWSLTVFAALSLPCGIGGASGILLAMVLAATAIVEFVGVRRLRMLDPTAPRWLALNQLALAAAVVLYAGWNLYLASTNRGMPTVLTDEMSQLGMTRPDGADLARQAANILYVTLAVVGGGMPVLTARFYASKAKALRAYLTATPAWIVQMRRDQKR